MMSEGADRKERAPFSAGRRYETLPGVATKVRVWPGLNVPFTAGFCHVTEPSTISCAGSGQVFSS
jgi:hypothetical protein